MNPEAGKRGLETGAYMRRQVIATHVIATLSLNQNFLQTRSVFNRSDIQHDARIG